LIQNSRPDPDDYGVSQLCQLGKRRLAHPLEAKAGAIGQHFVDAVEKEHVEVNVQVQVQGRAKSLDQRDRAGAGRLLRVSSLPRPMSTEFVARRNRSENKRGQIYFYENTLGK